MRGDTVKRPVDFDVCAIVATALREAAALVESGAWPVEREDVGWGVLLRLGPMPRDVSDMDYLSWPSLTIRARVHCNHTPRNDVFGSLAHYGRHEHGTHGLLPAGSWWCSACREVHLRGEVCEEEGTDGEASS